MAPACASCNQDKCCWPVLPLTKHLAYAVDMIELTIAIHAGTMDHGIYDLSARNKTNNTAKSKIVQQNRGQKAIKKEKLDLNQCFPERCVAVH